MKPYRDDIILQFEFHLHAKKALIYLLDAIRATHEAKRLAIQSQGFANLSQELVRINRGD